MEKKLKVGILGAGRIGRLHTENIIYRIPDVEVSAIADAFLNDDMIKWAKNLGVANITKDPDDIFKNDEINAVLICSSTDTHAKFIIDAAKAGKHIFCEKPIDYDIVKIKEALNAVEKAGVKLQIGFVRRFDHNHKKVHDTVKSGKIGDPHIIKITSRDPEPPPVNYIKVSGGLFFDMTIHDFDMARYLSCSEVEEVYAKATVLVDPTIGELGDVDTAIVILKFKNGALGVIDNSRKSNYGYDQRTEVLGSRGCVMVSNDTPNSAEIYTEEGIEREKPLWFFLERYNDAFIAELRAFFDSILNDTEPLVTGNDGLQPVLIAMAANRSLKENRPVKIDEIKF